MTDFKSGAIPLIDSIGMEVVGGRFLVKASFYNDGSHPESVMLVIRDLVDGNFKIQFFKDRASAGDLLKLLNAADKS